MNKINFSKLQTKEDMIIAFNQLKDDYKKLFANNEKLKSLYDKALSNLAKDDHKIIKAIEYVEHHKFNKFGDIDCGEAEEIINILNGGDDNE